MAATTLHGVDLHPAAAQSDIATARYPGESPCIGCLSSENDVLIALSARSIGATW